MILVVGDVGWDVLFQVARFPGPDEKVFADSVTFDVGGVGANTAAAAGLLGGEAWFVGRLGSDPFGALVRQRLTELPVDLSLCRVDPGATTPLALIATDPSGEKRIVLAPSSGMFPDPSQVPGGSQMRVDWLHLVAYDLDAAAAIAASLPGVPASLDLEPASVPCGEVALMAPLVGRMDTVIANNHAVALFGGSPEETIRTLQAWGAGVVVLTRGADGAVCAVAGQRHAVRPPRVEVVDTTGAGDMFAGAYALARTRGSGPEAATAYAVAAATLSCRGLGPRGAVPASAEIESALTAMEGT